MTKDDTGTPVETLEKRISEAILAMSDLPFVFLTKASAALQDSADPKAWAAVNQMRAECGLTEATRAPELPFAR